ncbi:MAG: hypothetical protein R3C45_18460 [Phycisphaerales bacterium]
MGAELRYRQLRQNQRELVDLMSEIGFGRIEQLIVQAGQPVFSPPPRVVREFKLELEDAEAGGIATATDYALKAQVRCLLRRLTQLGHGRVESIAVAHGLPTRMSITTP